MTEQWAVARPGHTSSGVAPAEQAYADLVELVGHGPRFHGGKGIAAASRWLQSQLEEAGLVVRREPVPLLGWSPGTTHRVTVRLPIERELPAWPMLWSGASDGPVRGRVQAVGPQGLWGDSMTWRKFLVVDDRDRCLAYLHARDDGPAAPQPLPSGSDLDVPHLAIGRLDGCQITEWLTGDKPVEIELDANCSRLEIATSDNLVVDIPGNSDGSVLVCAHYDTFFNTIGAYDNGSGTIALLHLAQRWAAAQPTSSVRLVFFTAEEWHLAGSRHHVAGSDEAQLTQIDYVVNLDGLGRGSFLEVFASPETFSTALRAAVQTYAQRTRPDLQLVSRFPPTTGTDDASFYRAGVPSAFMTFNDLHRLHQPDDLPNQGIAENIVWTVALAEYLVENLKPPARTPTPGIL